MGCPYYYLHFSSALCFRFVAKSCLLFSKAKTNQKLFDWFDFVSSLVRNGSDKHITIHGIKSQSVSGSYHTHICMMCYWLKTKMSRRIIGGTFLFLT
jgi:hypothetical protein